MIVQRSLSVAGLLNKKRALLEEISSLLDIQDGLFKAEDYETALSKCREIDNLLENLEETDVHVAQLTSLSANAAVGDYELTKIVNQIFELARYNSHRLQQMIVSLIQARNEIKAELGNTVRQGQIGGYKPFINTRSYFLDRLN